MGRRRINMTNKPSYRFKGYAESWEEKKLGEVTSDLKSGLSRMLANEDIGLPVIRANNINDGYLDISNDIKYWYEVDPQGSNTNNYVVEENDILINFINSEAKMGTSAIVRFPLDRKTIYTTNILRLRVSEGISSNFIFYIFSISRYINFIKSITKPAVNQSSFTTVDFKKFIIFIPSLPEQTAIGSFFQDIDQLISLQQRKLEVLKEQKKTYLKLLFPAKGQTKPALRFAGFEDVWKEVKLGDVGETYTGLSGKTKEDFGHGEGKFITYVNVFNNPLTDLYGLDSVEIDDKQRRVQYGDVLFTTSSETPEDVGLSSVWMGTEDNVYLNSFCFGYRPQKGIFDLYYLAFVLRSYRVRREFMLLAQGISRFNISKTKVMDMFIHVPSLPEQEAIGSFFQGIDKAIAKQEEKVNQLKESKQTLLRKMFI